MSASGSGNDVTISLIAEDRMTPVFNQVSASMGLFTGNAERMVNSLARLGAEVAPVVAIGAAFVYMGQQASAVQQNVANLNAVLHATSEQLAAIRQNGLALSQATQFTDAQILSAQRQLAKGGADAVDLAVGGSGGVTGSTLNLASATQNDPTKAATAMVAANTAFQLSTKDSATTATILAQAVDTSVGSLDTMMTALKQSGVVARAAGMDLKDTTNTIAALQNAGLQSSAGTSLQTFLARVESPSATARKEIQALNLEFYNLNGTLKSTPELFDEIRSKTMALTPEAANNSLFNIFGQRGIRVADIAMEQGSSGLTEQASRAAELGDAAEIAAKKLDTFQGSSSKALSSVNVLAVQFGSALIPGMKGFADDTQRAANFLSDLNNQATILPQIAVGIAAIGAVRKLGSVIDNRADERDSTNQAAIDRVNQSRIQQAADVSNAVARAEFEADSKTLANKEQTAAAIKALNDGLYESYIANEAKVVEAQMSADEKRMASLQSLTQKTLSSIAEIDAAYVASAQAQVDRQALQFQKQSAYLDIEQAAATKKLTAQQASGATPFSIQRASQDVDRQALEARQAVDAEMLQRDLDIQQRASFAKRDATIAAAEQQTQTIERAGEAERQAALAAGDRNAIAYTEAAAKEAAAIRAGAVEKQAAIEASYLGAVGTTGIGPGITAVEGSIMQKMAGQELKVPANVSVTPNNVVAASTFVDDVKGKVGPVLAKAGSLLGDLIMPVTIAILAKEMLIGPIEKAVIDRAAGQDSQLNAIHIQTRTVIDHPADDQRVASAAIDQQIQAVKDEIGKKQAELARDQGAWTENVPVLSGLAHSVGGDSADIGAAKKQIQSLTQDLADLQKQSGIESVVPKQAMSDANDEMTKLLQSLKDETITQAQADQQWKLWQSSVNESTNSLKTHDDYLRAHGVSEDQIISLNKRFVDSEAQVVQSLKDAREEAELTYRTAAQQSIQAEPLGVDPQAITRAYFGKNLDQTDATKSQVDAAKKTITEYENAWKNAQSVVNSIDISKGITAFGDLSMKIDDANAKLAAVGQQNAALTALGQIATSFRGINDAETQAMAGLEGYNLTLEKTQGYIGQLDAVQKRYEDAVQEALARRAAGRNTPTDDQLISNRPNIEANIVQQRQTLSQSIALDVLGEVRNLPDFAKLDEYVRDVIAKAGGGINVVATVKADTTEARNQIDEILKPRTMDVTINPIFSQFDPAIADRAKSWSQYYSNMGGNSPYDGGGVPPGSPFAGTAPPFPGPGQAQAYAYGANNPGGNPGAGGLGYKQLSEPDYEAIVASGSGGKASPIGNPKIYAEVMKAAQAANVDPRLLLTFMQMENNDATNISSANLAANNFGGITYQPTTNPAITRGPAKPEGGNYAAYATPEDFFKALAANLSTQQYASAFNQGDVGAIRRTYVTGGGPGSYEQEQNIASTVGLYGRLASRYPAASGSGANLGVGLGGISGFDTTAAGGSVDNTDTIVSSVRAQIIQKALSQVGQDKLVNYCEQFVEETIQAITGKRGATGTNEGTASSAFAHAASEGLVTKNPQPGDLVYYPDAAGGTGHVAIYVGAQNGTPMQVSTYDKGSTSDPQARKIHVEAVGAGAQYVSVDGQPIYGVGDPGNRGNATGGTLLAQNPFYLTGGRGAYGQKGFDATQSGANPYPERIYPTDALPYLNQYGAQMGNLDAKGQGQTQRFFDMLAPVFQTIENDKLGFGPTGAQGRLNIQPGVADKQLIDNAALKDNLQLSTAVGAAIQNINKDLPVTAAQWAAIRDAAGPLAPMVVAEVQATADLESHTAHLNQLKQDQQAADLAHQATVQQRTVDDQTDQRAQTSLQWTRQQIDRQTQDNRTAIQDREQDEDRARQRKQTLDQRMIDDARTTQQRTWQDEETNIQHQTMLQQEQWRLQDVADQSHKQTLDDAYTTTSRQLQDQQRILDFRGGQASITLQDQKKALDEQHRISSEGMQQNEGLYVALGKGSSTEAQATAYASQAAIIDDARKKADQLYQRQAEANQRAQDDLSKQHAQQMFNLQTEMLQEQRKHEDEIRGIDEAATARHNAQAQESFQLQVEAAARTASHLLITRQQEDEDKIRSRSYEDTTYQIETTRILQERNWKAADERTQIDRQAADEEHTRRLWRIQDIRTAEDTSYNTTKLLNQQQQQDENTSITKINAQISGLDIVIGKYDTLLKMFGNAAGVALNAPSQNSTVSLLPSQPVGGGSIPRLGGKAIGSFYSEAGPSTVNELGGEIRVLRTGETVIPADQTKRMMDAVLRSPGSGPQSGATVMQQGNVTIHMGDKDVTLSEGAQVRIRAIVQEEIDNATPNDYTAYAAATGRIRR